MARVTRQRGGGGQRIAQALKGVGQILQAPLIFQNAQQKLQQARNQTENLKLQRENLGLQIEERRNNLQQLRSKELGDKLDQGILSGDPNTWLKQHSENLVKLSSDTGSPVDQAGIRQIVLEGSETVQAAAQNTIAGRNAIAAVLLGSKVSPEQFNAAMNKAREGFRIKINTFSGSAKQQAIKDSQNFEQASIRAAQQIGAERRAEAPRRRATEAVQRLTPFETPEELAVAERVGKIQQKSQEKIDKLREQTFKNTGDLRKEFTKLEVVKDFSKQSNALSRIIGSAKRADFAGDLALVFNFMKLLDPGSVVRESEFATAQNAPGVPERIRGLYNRALSGQRFTPGVRAIFVDRARSIFNESKQTFDVSASQFRGLATKNQLSPEDVVLDPSLGLEERADELVKKSVQAFLRSRNIPKEAVETISEQDVQDALGIIRGGPLAAPQPAPPAQPQPPTQTPRQPARQPIGKQGILDILRGRSGGARPGTR